MRGRCCLMLLFPGTLMLMIWLLGKGIDMPQWNARVNAVDLKCRDPYRSSAGYECLPDRLLRGLFQLLRFLLAHAKNPERVRTSTPLFFTRALSL